MIEGIYSKRRHLETKKESKECTRIGRQV